MAGAKSPLNYEVIPIDDSTRVRFYTSADPGSYIPTHWHDALEIVYLQSGTLRFTIGQYTRLMEAGQCMLVNPNVMHSTLCTEPNAAVVLQVPLSLLNAVIPDMYRTAFQLENRTLPAAEYADKLAHFKKTLEKMQAMNDGHPEGGVLLFNSLLYDLLYQLYMNFRVTVSPAEAKNKSETLRRLTVVLDFTAQNYARPIPLQEVAQVAAMQPNYFCRFFKKNMGSTFLEYQNSLRLAHILRDLVRTDDSVSTILERHGFTNYKLFCRMFRKKFGMTPTQVRKNLRDGSRTEEGLQGV